MHIFIVLLIVFCWLPDDAVLTTSSGDQIVGELTDFAENGILFRQQADQDPEMIEFGQVASIEFEPQPISEVLQVERCKVQLVDDSTLMATAFEIKDGMGSVFLASGSKFQIESRNVADVLLKIPADGRLANEWNRIRQTTLEAGDALIIRRDGKYESLEGVVGDITADHVQFKMDDQSANINRQKIDGIVFYHASGRKLPKPVCQLIMNDRSALMVRSLKMEDSRVLVTLAAGTELSIPRASFSKMDFSLGRVVMLGDMQPTSRDWTPLIASATLLKKLRELKLPCANQSFDNRKLELRMNLADGLSTGELRAFESGYAMVSGSKLAFSLESKYERLTGLVGFSPRSGDGGDLLLKIRGDNEVLFERRMQKANLEGPIEIDLNIKDCNRLVIEVDYHDGLAIGDTVHLCDLKVSR